MTDLVFTAMPERQAAAFRAGAADAYGNQPEKAVSPGGMPCRHCLGKIDAGEGMLILAYRPFPSLQPYAETGPIFLHAEDCGRYPQTDAVPPMLDSPDYIVRGYGADDRIVYGTGAVTATGEIVARAGHLLERGDVAYVHVRSARNNCYQCRIDTA
ncbi:MULTISPECIES: DUF1203 domain-containing protein [unclassified Rhizobium]|uniref:DUF1203 domain-containing protein n=1 Tax=unclassified Rhizobium TaxID=2613769 RepID=UPI00247A5011|nr:MULTISPECIES: DUF1203 domain-containing protein [unclassified Rhizobium]MDH7800502.1 hypothetical protein [Rhizobium sp. AN70]